ncbi:MAG: transporter ATP-binding protein [Parcubacteria group bacterium]|nr:transporter ATP-binding protein [Parcubacteria group bacterium]
MNTDKNIISVEDLSFSYDGKTNVLKGVSLCIRSGEYLGVIGPNGGGKTTLLKLMLGLLTPEHGRIKLLGQDVRKFRDWYRIGYVSQRATQFDSLFPATVEEVVIMGRYARRGLFRRVTAEDRAKALEALIDVGMLEYRMRRIDELSGGQKQRVMLARALAGEPEIIILDEPTTGVDQETENQFYRLLARLHKEQGMTLLLVSHDLDRVAQEATCVAVIDTELRYYDDPREAASLERSALPHHH